jgi:hypothetical protein
MDLPPPLQQQFDVRFDQRTAAITSDWRIEPTRRTSMGSSAITTSAARLDDVNVWRAVVIRMDADRKTSGTKHGRHERKYHPRDLGFE